MRKNKIALILLVVALIMCFCTVFVACDDNKDDDGDKGNGSVVTIVPPNDGWPKAEYRVSVLYPDKTPAVGVEVKLYLDEDDDDDLPYTGATTGNDGVAIMQAATDMKYYILLDRIPAGYLYEDSDTILATETSKIIYLESETMSNRYSITVTSEGGMPMNNLSVSLVGNGTSTTKNTNAEGNVKIKVPELGEYDIVIENLPKGYTVVGGDQKTNASSNSVAITVKSAVIQESLPKNHRYKMDDIMYDFTVTNTEGKAIKLSELLKTKKFVMINFWATWCGPCKAEFDDIQRAYEGRENDVAVIAMSKDDTSTEVINFKNGYTPALTFDMSVDENGLYSAFTEYFGSSIPGSVFIDRYGKICNFLFGGGTEAFFKKQFAYYTAEDYVQTAYDPTADESPDDVVDKPEDPMPSSDTINSKISPNFNGTYAEYGKDDTTWPWYLGTDTVGNTTYDILYSGNIKHHSTVSYIDFTFTLGVDEFLTFDYKMNTEDIGNADIMSVYIDNSWVCDLERISDGWQTKYLYTPRDAADAQEEHTLTLMYSKDSSDSYLTGEEFVAIKNLRKCTKSELKGDVNVLREAAWGYKEVDGINRFTQYVNVVLNPEDGYYHVGTADGPYLLANLGSATQYNNNSVSALASGGYFGMVGLQGRVPYITTGLADPGEGSYVEASKGYAWFATHSDVEGYCYVDQQLYETLDVMVDKFSKTLVDGQYLTKYYTDNTWLELCKYYDNYNGEPLGNILSGISEKEAIEANDSEEGNHVVVNKTLVPRGVIYKYVATKTGAYKVYSVLPAEYNNQKGAYVHISGKNVSKSEDSLYDFEQYVTFEKGETYYIGAAFNSPSEMGEYNFYIEYLGESMDHLTDATEGTYAFEFDENGNYKRDESGNLIFSINLTNGLQVDVDSEGYYRQKLADGSLDMGDNGYIWIAMSVKGILLDATLKGLANGTYKVQGFENVKFFDFTAQSGQDYTQYILDLCEEAENQDEDSATYGMVKATTELVEVIKKAFARIEHDSTYSWLGTAYFYEHLGVYPANPPSMGDDADNPTIGEETDTPSETPSENPADGGSEADNKTDGEN